MIEASKTQEDIAASFFFLRQINLVFVIDILYLAICVYVWHLKLTVRVSPSSAIIATYISCMQHLLILFYLCFFRVSLAAVDVMVHTVSAL